MAVALGLVGWTASSLWCCMTESGSQGLLLQGLGAVAVPAVMVQCWPASGPRGFWLRAEGIVS